MPSKREACEGCAKQFPDKIRVIEALDYDVLARRPSVSKLERVLLLAGVLARAVFRKAA